MLPFTDYHQKTPNKHESCIFYIHVPWLDIIIFSAFPWYSATNTAYCIMATNFRSVHETGNRLYFLDMQMEQRSEWLPVFLSGHCAFLL